MNHLEISIYENLDEPGEIISDTDTSPLIEIEDAKVWCRVIKRGVSTFRLFTCTVKEMNHE